MYQTSLTSPADLSETWKPLNDSLPTLTAEQERAAVVDLTDKSNLEYPQIEKVYSDPIYDGQKFCMHSFIQSKGATPDKDGIFGMIKCRGTFMNQEDMNQRSEWLIRNTDSFHPIYHSFTGKPFPATSSDKFSQETKKIDIRKKIVETVSESIKEKKAQEQQAMEEVRQREKELTEDVSQDQPIIDVYTTTRVKRAHQIHTYIQTIKKLEEIKQSIVKSRTEINRLDIEEPYLKKEYLERYNDAREKAGMKQTSGMKKSESDFTMYLEDEPEDLGF